MTLDPETPADASDDGGGAIAKDDAFHLLQNARRRAVLRYFLAHEDREQFRMRDVAEAIAAWEHDTTVQQLRSEERQRVYIALYQSHLPKLDDHGVIRYHQARGLVEPTGLLRVFEPYLGEGLDAATHHLHVAGPSGSQSGPDDRSSAKLTKPLSALFAR